MTDPRAEPSSLLVPLRQRHDQVLARTPACGPPEGVNAVLETAHKTVALQALNGRRPEVNCNVGCCGAAPAPTWSPAGRPYRWRCGRPPVAAFK